MTSFKKRLALDAALAVLTLVLMPYGLLPPLLHELSGVALFALVLIHVYVNRRWFKTLFSGIYTPIRAYRIALVVALASAFLAQFLSGVVISGELLTFLPELSVSSSARDLHLPIGAWILLLVGLHAGDHWLMLTRKLNGRPTLRALVIMTSTALLLQGGYEFYRQGIADYLTANVPFANFDYDAPLALVIERYFALFFAYFVVGALVSTFLRACSHDLNAAINQNPTQTETTIPEDRE